MREQETHNPANPRPQTAAGAQVAAKDIRRRVPMAIPRQKLALPDIPGYHVHWINDYPGRVLSAQEGGYEFVTPEEGRVLSRAIANDPAQSGNTDLGDRISIVVGQDNGQPLRAYAMKIRNEWFEEDQALLSEKNRQIQQAIRDGSIGSEQGSAADRKQRYVRTAQFSSGETRFPNRRA